MASQSESLRSQDSSEAKMKPQPPLTKNLLSRTPRWKKPNKRKLEEDDIELLYESFINLREENKLIKEELAKQNNLLWEIYEELKEIKSK